MVPQWVAEAFVKATGSGSCARLYRVEQAEHHTGWVSRWFQLNQTLPQC